MTKKILLGHPQLDHNHESCERVSAVWNGLSEDSNSGSLARFKNSILAIDFTAHLKCF